MKCKYCKKKIYLAYWGGELIIREFTTIGSKAHSCYDSDIKKKSTGDKKQ
jgi:hypothetical protein